MARKLLDLVDIMDELFETEYSYRDACEIRPRPVTREQLLALGVQMNVGAVREAAGGKPVVLYCKALDAAAYARIDAKIKAQREARRGSR